MEVSSVTLRDALDILETEQIIYRKRSLGIFVSPNIHRKSIHIFFSANNLISEVLSPFWALLWMRLEQEVRRREQFKNEIYTFHLVPQIADTRDSVPEDVKELLRTQRVHGVLAVGLHTVGLGEDTEPSIPCVTFAGGGSWLVIIDNAEEGRMAADELHRQGCKRLGCWLPNMLYFDIPGWNAHDIPHLSLEEMASFLQFRKTLEEKKLTYYPEFMRLPHLPLSQQVLSPQEQGYLLAKEVYGGASDLKPDGLFIGDDLLADGALTALEEMGIKIGKDVKVIVHTNAGSPILFGHLRKITALEYNPLDIAQAMFLQLDTLMAGLPLREPNIMIRPRLRK
ncbi:hypothetical protein KTT_38420 [Tengunoibacter tsumagoiensis]|uniref:Transcriptional regulator LacI/GalR-like sensor domain-containing protein n=2 Tax=Tengunoibacter tsumagoiensis TaxID=2014871 RepID=A0A402A4B7_9CHLR|nr:hypothetical protein KTT_38420 [Tengunoibacter tsumagoiensis]